MRQHFPPRCNIIWPGGKLVRVERGKTARKRGNRMQKPLIAKPRPLIGWTVTPGVAQKCSICCIIYWVATSRWNSHGRLQWLLPFSALLQTWSHLRIHGYYIWLLNDTTTTTAFIGHGIAKGIWLCWYWSWWQAWKFGRCCVYRNLFVSLLWSRMGIWLQYDLFCACKSVFAV